MTPDGYERVTPTDEQLASIQRLRAAFKDCGQVIMMDVPNCADRTHALRLLRTSLMWCNMAVTHLDDGSQRP